MMMETIAICSGRAGFSNSSQVRAMTSSTTFGKCFQMRLPWTLVLLLALCVIPLYCQTGTGELHLIVTDPSGRAVQSTVHLISEANQYDAMLHTNSHGQLIVQRLPFGKYQIEIR